MYSMESPSMIAPCSVLWNGFTGFIVDAHPAARKKGCLLRHRRPSLLPRRRLRSIEAKYLFGQGRRRLTTDLEGARTKWGLFPSATRGPRRLGVPGDRSSLLGRLTTAGAKARFLLAGSAAWLKPCPDTKPNAHHDNAVTNGAQLLRD
jgi:hypothetical protein